MSENDPCPRMSFHERVTTPLPAPGLRVFLVIVAVLIVTTLVWGL